MAEVGEFHSLILRITGEGSYEKPRNLANLIMKNVVCLSRSPAVFEGFELEVEDNWLV